MIEFVKVIRDFKSDDVEYKKGNILFIVKDLNNKKYVIEKNDKYICEYPSDMSAKFLR